LATKLIASNKIKLNNAECKPAKELVVGDVLTIQKNNATFSFRVKALTEKRLGAKLVHDYIDDETSEEEIEKYKTYQAAQRNYRGRDQGKPSKKDRRELDDFLEGW
jgi:ribosome-associated heat shock protein Hsp15